MGGSRRAAFFRLAAGVIGLLTHWVAAPFEKEGFLPLLLLSAYPFHHQPAPLNHAVLLSILQVCLQCGAKWL
ncbi:hypothetical protein EYF80_041944 [Liparis tanakae]|uniref:Uncharacterized protein n=1 Tax=Liparis tanakae TaxID=230148 RepID=A0A4Z2G3U6_9TELE|nr:hypothetical protein EYF80_041944 [Liparis tanakae]